MNKMRLFLFCILAACLTIQAGAAELLWEMHPGKKKIQVDKAKGVKVRIQDRKCARIRKGCICTGDEDRLQWVQTGGNVSMDEPFAMVVSMKVAWDDVSCIWPVMFSMGENPDFNIKAAVDTKEDVYAVERESYNYNRETQVRGGKPGSSRCQTYILQADGIGGFTLYVDGKRVAFMEVDAAHVREDVRISHFSLGGRPHKNDNRCPVEVKSVRFYRGKVDKMTLFMADYGLWIYVGGGVLGVLLACRFVRRRKKRFISQKKY